MNHKGPAFPSGAPSALSDLSSLAFRSGPFKGPASCLPLGKLLAWLALFAASPLGLPSSDNPKNRVEKRVKQVERKTAPELLQLLLGELSVLR